MRMTLAALVVIGACGDNGSRATSDAPTTRDDAAIADTAPDAMPDAGGCGVLAADPADVFVDSASTFDSIGTAACPFHTIGEAVALAAPVTVRTVHVAAGMYPEAAIVSIPPNVTVVGAGEDAVTIDGGGICAVTATPCTVSVAGGGALRGVTVTSATGDAIVVSGGTGTASIDHATATNAKRFGFVIRTTAQLDHVTARGNKQDGLNAKSAVVTVTSSDFIDNQDNALDIDQGASLLYTSGLVTGNSDAIFLHGGSTLTSVLTDLDIEQNLGFGILCAGEGLKLRGTTMIGNEIGLVLDVTSGGTFDLGTPADLGNNLFAGPNAGDVNVRAGLCLEQSPATQTQLVEGNTWRHCPPPAKMIGPFCRSNNTYSDIAFVPAVAPSGSPIVPPATCTASP